MPISYNPKMPPNALVKRKSEPVIAVYESRANPADHPKIKGIHDVMQMP